METPRPVSPPTWVEAKSDPLLPELRLFFLSPTHWRWQERCGQWETHVNVFASLVGGSMAKKDWKDSRIGFLFQHLNTVDAKFGVLLTVNTLLLVALNVVMGIVVALNKPVFGRAIEIPAIAFAVVWFLSTVLCLIGQRRLVWGDLGVIGKMRHAWKDFTSLEKLYEAEDAHVRALIVELVRRTNKFRIAILFTHLQLILFALTLIAGIASLLLRRPVLQ